MRRAVAVALAVAALGAVAARATDPPVALTVAADTPADVRALAAETWDRFTAALPTARACLRPATLSGVWSFDERADYDRMTATIRLRIPSTAANLEATLLHELGHHLDASCPELGRRAAFLAATGTDPATPWWTGEDWSSTPAERYAEAVARVVLGAPPPHVLIDLDPAEVEAVRAWALG
jgi:hypothetical protein